MYGILSLKRDVRQHSNFQDEPSEIGVPLAEVPPLDVWRSRRETQRQRRCVSHGALADIVVLMRRSRRK